MYWLSSAWAAAGICPEISAWMIGARLWSLFVAELEEPPVAEVLPPPLDLLVLPEEAELPQAANSRHAIPVISSPSVRPCPLATRPRHKLHCVIVRPPSWQLRLQGSHGVDQPARQSLSSSLSATITLLQFRCKRGCTAA